MQTRIILHRRSQRILEKFLDLQIVTPFIVPLRKPVTHAKDNAFECRQSSDTTDKPLSKLDIRRGLEHYQLDPQIPTWDWEGENTKEPYDVGRGCVLPEDAGT